MKNEKIKVTSLEIIVTGKREKPYFEIKYKEVGKRDYNIGYSSYDLNNVFAWRDECFDVVNHKRNIFQRLFMEVKCMLMNFIAFVVCAVAAIYQGVNGNLGSCLLDIALALINLPYAIKWLKEFFAD